MSEVRTEDGLFEVLDAQTFVRRWLPETAGGIPLVLLHDSLGSVEQWRDFPALLARRLQRPVVAYDRPGFGRSSPRTGAPSLDFIAEEAQAHFPALRDALGLDAFGLFGHSVGGAMAMVIAATLPVACRHVITESAQAFVEDRTLDGIRAAQSQFEDEADFQRLVRWHGDRARWVLEAWTGAWLDPDFAGWNLDPWLPQVRCPVLAIHGDRDEFGSIAFPERIARGVPGASRIAIVQDCGHVPHRERPDEVSELASVFLRETAAERTP